MGVYYYYVNESKQQLFCIDPAEWDIKQYALGRNLGSRALSYLLLENCYESTGIEPHPLIGSWVGDRIYVTGDDYGASFKAIRKTYTNIAQEILELVVEVSPFDLLEYGGVDWFLRVVENNGDPVTITPAMRQRIAREFRLANYQHPDDDLQRAIDAIRIEPSY